MEYENQNFCGSETILVIEDKLFSTKILTPLLVESPRECYKYLYFARSCSFFL